jgi:apolipoprotein N-acyltransferase
MTSGRGVWATALALAGFEGLRAVVFTGFPWGGLSQGLVDTPYAQGLAFVGPYGMSLALLLSIAAIARLLHCKAHWGIALGALILVPLFLPAPETPTSSGPIVRLIQPNAPQDQKWDPEMMPVFLDRSVAFTGAEGAPDVIIWPETSVPFLLRSAGPAFERISTAAGHTPLVLGLQRGQGGEYYNSLAVLDAQGQHVATYDKRHLVPFGEYIPFADMLGRFGLRGLADILGGGFTAGQGSQIIDIPGIGAAYALICYEGIFAHEIRYETRPRMLLMITNDAWFGNLSGPKQHLAQAQMRAIEQGLPLIRAANTGISAVIAPDGEIIAALGLGQAGFLDAQLPAALSPTLYSKFGDWPFWVSILFGAVLCIVMPLRHRP